MPEYTSNPVVNHESELYYSGVGPSWNIDNNGDRYFYRMTPSQYNEFMRTVTRFERKIIDDYDYYYDDIPIVSYNPYCLYPEDPEDPDYLEEEIDEEIHDDNDIYDDDDDDDDGEKFNKVVEKETTQIQSIQIKPSEDILIL